VKILTGDNELVTRKVCHDVAMPITRIVTGPQLAALDDAAFAKEVDEANVLARLTPDQKEKVIKTLRAQGHVVGFMGDGINDVLAMKAADVGISVDTAVDVAKESADIILLEKSLLVLEDGIIEGRKVFGNIIKYIKMGASSNFGNMFSVVGGAYFLPFLPMAPIQVLVNNLLYDFSQVGIPLDNVDRSTSTKPRRWNIKSIQKFMFFIGPISSIFDYATFFLMLYFFGCKAYVAGRRGRRPTIGQRPSRTALPHRLVRRIAAHADADRPHHPHATHPVHPEPGEQDDDVHHPAGHGRRRLAAVLAGGAFHRADAAAPGVFPLDRRIPSRLQRADAHGEDVVPPVWPGLRFGGGAAIILCAALRSHRGHA
jgi:hypothetical protein